VTYTLFILWTAITQTPAAAAQQAHQEQPISVIVNVSTSDEAAKVELAQRERLSKLEVEGDLAGSRARHLDRVGPGRPDLVFRFSSRTVKNKSGPRADLEVFLPRKGGADGNMIALAIDVVNPRGRGPGSQPRRASPSSRQPACSGAANAENRTRRRARYLYAIEPGCAGRIAGVRPGSGWFGHRP
jgi:hypothetical protein